MKLSTEKRCPYCEGILKEAEHCRCRDINQAIWIIVLVASSFTITCLAFSLLMLVVKGIIK